MNGLYYTCNMKRSGKYKRREEDECTKHRCPKSLLVAIVDHFKNFKGI